MRGRVGDIWEGVIVNKLRLIAQCAALRVKELPHLNIILTLYIYEQKFSRIYLLQAISHGLKFMINFLHSKVNMKFEVQFQVNFVVFFVRHKFSIIPHLGKINDYHGLLEIFKTSKNSSCSTFSNVSMS